MIPLPTPPPRAQPIAGSGLGFSTDIDGVPPIPTEFGQAWDCRGWSGLPLHALGILPAFVLTVPKPEDLATSPYCAPTALLLDGVTGATLDPIALTGLLIRMTDSTTLYLLSTGGAMYRPNPLTGEADLAKPIRRTGPLRLKIGPLISAPFEAMPAGSCYYQIRLANSERIGNLLYGSSGFEQRFGVVGELTGPTYAQTDDQDKGSGRMTKQYVLDITDAGESVADALALVTRHSVVELRQINSSGNVVRVVTSLASRATAEITPSGDRFGIKLTLPVSETAWGSEATGCGVADPGDLLQVVTCE